MRTEEFRQGVEDARAGRRPRFDGKGLVMMPLEGEEPEGELFSNLQWNYERGRQFGILAPRDLSVMIRTVRKRVCVNPAALRFFSRYTRDIL
jgi:hypothetical protein